VVHPTRLPGAVIAGRLAPLGLGWPNLISALRIVLMPVLVALVLVETRGASYAAAGVFVAGGLSDGLDGYLARRHAMTTRTGMWLDPLSDKLLVSAAVVALAAVGRFPVWAAIVILVREVAVTVLRAVRGTQGASMPASSLAKAKTASQLLAVTLYLLPLGRSANGTKLAVLIVAVAFTVASGLDYFVRVRPPAKPRAVA
jgi:CDP-diacylglycerol---glycerol-3-phosphate 3-phosphatidyltransferase